METGHPSTQPLTRVVETGLYSRDRRRVVINCCLSALEGVTYRAYSTDQNTSVITVTKRSQHCAVGRILFGPSVAWVKTRPT